MGCDEKSRIWKYIRERRFGATSHTSLRQPLLSLSAISGTYAGVIGA